MGDQVAPELIELNVYRFPDGGLVKSLAYKTGEGQDATHGVIIPGITGQFDFGIAKRREEICVVQGMVTYREHMYGIFNCGDKLEFDNVIVIEQGERILLECASPAAYNCVYG